jgi:HK97 family phage prohead protease
MEYKHLQIKAMDGQGIVEGYVAIFGNIDSYGDIILPGAFTKTLQEYKSFPVLYMHDPSKACGITTDIFEDKRGLYLRVQLDLDTELGRTTFSGVKKKYINCWSIGYTVKKDSVNSKGNRLLEEVTLLECSLITKHFSANPEALVTGFKSNSHRYSTEDSEGKNMDMYGGMEEDMKRMRSHHQKLRDDHEDLREDHEKLRREHRKLKRMVKDIMARMDGDGDYDDDDMMRRRRKSYIDLETKSDDSLFF